MMKNDLNKLVRDEKGQALILVLILMLVGGLIIAPLLGYMGTGLKVGQTYEETMARLYAADAGIEDGLWRIKNDQVPEWMKETWDDAVYDHDPYTYPLSPVNDKDVGVSIQPIWVIGGLGEECLGKNLPEGTTPHSEMVTVGDYIGTVDGNGLYQISITYEGGGAQMVRLIGAWLPAGFNYVEGTSNLGFDPEPYDRRGGTALLWDYSPIGIKFEDLPGDDSKKTITFQFTPNQNPQSAFSWVRLKNESIALSWDVDIKIYKITSQATDAASGKSTTVEAYSVKNELRKLGSAILGDYRAVGNALMIETGGDPRERDTLLAESDAVVSDIPSDAEVEAAYLYWSGWFEEGLEADTTAIFKIDGTQVYFDELGEPQIDISETEQIIADSSQVINNLDYGNPHGYSYSSKKDVTALVRAFTDEGAYGNYPGNATYTVGSVDADWDKDDEWAYAGWSLIIIYSSAETYGHQLYLYDTFSYCDHQMNLDFDYDGEDGGIISGFLVPEPIAGEVNAATLTAFVGEGDDWYNGDFIALNAPDNDPPTSIPDSYKLWDSTEAESLNDVWNGQSVGMSADGVDVDTFYVTWESSLLDPGDTSAQIDIWTDIDIWNLVYIILSFRSEITTGGTVIYLIK